MTFKLKKLKRQKSREYTRNGRTKKYMILQHQYIQMKEEQMKRYMKDKIETLKTSNPSKFFKEIKKAGARPGDPPSEQFSVSSHLDRNLTNEEAAEEIARSFSKISNEYKPLDMNNLPPRVKEKF